MEIKGDGAVYDIPVIILDSEEGTETIWILNDPTNRLIVMMDIAFMIHLVGIESY